MSPSNLSLATHVGCQRVFGGRPQPGVGCGTASKLPWWLLSGCPPLPIPNREVKPRIADDTALVCGKVGRRQSSMGAPPDSGRPLLVLSPHARPPPRGFISYFVLFAISGTIVAARTQAAPNNGHINGRNVAIAAGAVNASLGAAVKVGTAVCKAAVRAGKFLEKLSTCSVMGRPAQWGRVVK